MATTWTDYKGRKWPVTADMGKWLTAYQDEALRRGYLKQGLDLWQTIGGAAKSAGTHLAVNGKACCIDTAQTSTQMVQLAREMGADATWHRKKNWDGRGGMEHCHINLRGIVNKYANYQYTSTAYGVDHGHNGLANGGKDDGPKPLSHRTWEEGIAWAKAQQSTPSKIAKTPVAVWGKPETFVIGATGPDVTRLGERLVIWAKALKLPAPYKTGPGSPLSATDVAAVKAFQKAQGWTGADADGYPGAETFKRLAADPATTTAPPVVKPPVVTSPKPPANTLTILTNNLWGYGKADSSATQSVRLPRFIDMVKHYMPDMIATQELSNQGSDKKVQHGDTKAKTPYQYVMDNLHDLGYAYDNIGSDGRYIFRLKSSVEFVKGKTILLTPTYQGDDKQAALGVYRKGGRLFSLTSAHTENEGSDDKYRVGQTKSAMSQTYAFAKPLGVISRWQIYAGDFNDHDNVLAAFKAKGYVDSFTRASVAHRIKAAVQSFGTYLKVYNGKRIDLVTVYKDVTVLSARQITEYADSDHHPQLVEIQL